VECEEAQSQARSLLVWIKKQKLSYRLDGEEGRKCITSRLVITFWGFCSGDSCVRSGGLVLGTSHTGEAIAVTSGQGFSSV